MPWIHVIVNVYSLSRTVQTNDPFELSVPLSRALGWLFCTTAELVVRYTQPSMQQLSGTDSVTHVNDLILIHGTPSGRSGLILLDQTAPRERACQTEFRSSESSAVRLGLETVSTFLKRGRRSPLQHPPLRPSVSMPRIDSALISEIGCGIETRDRGVRGHWVSDSSCNRAIRPGPTY
jgi:hypothetical protein